LIFAEDFSKMEIAVEESACLPTGASAPDDPHPVRHRPPRRHLLLVFLEACRETALAYRQCFQVTLLILTFIMALMAYHNSTTTRDPRGNDTTATSAASTLANVTRSLMTFAKEMLSSDNAAKRNSSSQAARLLDFFLNE
jgi:hypothetical protein